MRCSTLAVSAKSGFCSVAAELRSQAVRAFIRVQNHSHVENLVAEWRDHWS